METDDRGRPIPQPAHTFKLGRGAFLALTAGTVGALALGKGSLSALDLAPSVASADGFIIYTVTSGYPSFSPKTYRLRIDGMVEHPLTLTLADILREPGVTETKYYQCVTGWQVKHARWTGIPLSSLLDRVGPHPDARALTFYSFDGAYTESLTLEQARQPDVLLAYRLQGKALSRQQGAPLRLVVPGMYGYKYIKWVNRVELVREPINGFWERGGYDRDAYIGTSDQRYMWEGPPGGDKL